MCVKIYLLLFGVTLSLPRGSKQASSTPICRSPQALGMEDGRIPDSSITSSTSKPYRSHDNARLHYRGGAGRIPAWVPLDSDTWGNAWIQVDLGKTTKISHLQIQGRGGIYKQWVYKFDVGYSNDGTVYEWTSEFTRNVVDQASVTSHEFSPLIVARFIKIRPTASNFQSAIRLEIYGCPVERDCLDLLHGGNTRDGLYVVFPNGRDPLEVYCDQTTNGGGFAVLQRRLNGNLDFDKNWNEYKVGFGDLAQEFWLGNENLHTITSESQHLLVELEDFDNNAAHASYGTFGVASEMDNFILRVGGFTGTAGDSLSEQHNGQYFSTSDWDKDANDSRNCASEFASAWWFNQCHDSNLNGKYISSGATSGGVGIIWNSWTGEAYSLKTTAMKIRSQKEREWDYDLDFKGRSVSNLVHLPKVTGFKQLTVCWWMKTAAPKHWSTVFSLWSNAASLQILAFSYRVNGCYRLVVNNIASEFNVTEWPIANDYWHHVCITWTSTNGEWVFYVDGLKRKAGNTEAGVTLQGGALVIGQLHTDQRTYDNSSSFSGLLSRFNIWDKTIEVASAVEKTSHACSAETGNVVPWPEVYLRVEGNVMKQTSKLCSFPEMHRWNMLSGSKEVKLRDLVSGRDGVVSNIDGESQRGTLSLKNTSFVSVDFTGGCITNPSLCEHGLSVSFWLRHTRHDSDNCPENWLYFQGSCYYFSINKSTMEDSQSFCRQHGADLVVINSNEENIFIGQQWTSSINLGLMRSPVNWNMFVWVDGSSLTDPKWATNRPMGVAESKFCAKMGPSAEWYDSWCEATRKYICEKDDARHIISSRGTASSEPGLSFYYHRYTKSYKLSLSSESGNVWDLALSDDTIIESGWFLVTFTWNEQNGLRLYTEGALLAVVIPRTQHGMIVVETNNRRSRPHPYSNNTFASLVIGMDIAPDVKPRVTAVELSDLRIWETVLPKARIKELYQKSVQANEWYLWTSDQTPSLQWQMGGGCRDDKEKGSCEKAYLPTVKENLYLASNMTLLSFSSLALEQSLQWRVDVGKSILITEVVTYLDETPSASRPHKLQVRIGNSVNGSGLVDPMCGTTVTVLNETKRHVRCAMPRLGQYVTIQLSGHGNLTLTGVEVHRTIS